uniref:Uncharacterized protein n=1 Tax=Picea sitchensis TaxID=3332 RepID=A0A6B9XXE2_PICSI|nr:hypothetical protein Q903MT_gene6741 [Picea sitchensis]
MSSTLPLPLAINVCRGTKTLVSFSLFSLVGKVTLSLPRVIIALSGCAVIMFLL